MAGSNLLASRRTDLEACCCATSPVSGSVVAVGSYTLRDAATRDGLLLYHDAALPGLPEVGRLATPGIFDLRWCSDTCLLALACSNGATLLCAGLGELVAHSPPGDAMCTSVDWRSRDSLVSCGQDGKAHTLALRESGLEVVSSWAAHSLEAWVCRALPGGDSLLFTGGDDAAFRCWDARTPTPAGVFVDRRTHGAGVTAIETDPHNHTQVATGSYDDRLRLWDVRQPAAPVCTTCVPCGGGVWRMAWHPTDAGTLLLACMQAGFAVVKAGVVTHRIGANAAAGEHGSLGYGVTWCAAAGGLAALTASFYDKSLALTEVLHA